MQKNLKFPNKRFASIFKTKALNIVSQIPRGEVLTYKEVARRAGRPRAYRAVGNIMKQNRDPKVPCHRVIRSDGRIGKFNRGQKRKALLLEKEGVSPHTRKDMALAISRFEN